jgi:uncharacterized membrane protein YdbT with pleckstrin-like domain
VVGFPRTLLAEHETLILDLRPHWVALTGPALWTIAWLALTVLEYRLDVIPTGAKGIVAAIIVLAWVFLSVLPFLRWRYTMFVLTSDRLITRRGIIAKHSKEIPLENINDVAFSQSVLERMVGAGDLLIESAGERGQEHIENVRNPEQVQLTIYKQTESNSDRMMQPRVQPPGDDIPAQIEALARLRDQGTLTVQEFESKKAELLKRL